MASHLHIYELVSPGAYQQISEDAAFTNPITTVHDGKTGDIFEVKLYVGGDSDSCTYTNIQVSATSTEGDEVEIYSAGGASRGTSGWGVKLMVDPGYDPKERDWDAPDVNYGAMPLGYIEIADITSNAASTKRPFWFRIESPTGVRVENKNSISLELTFVEA